MRVEELFRGYKVPSSSPPSASPRRACAPPGSSRARESIGGGSDANVFRLAGFDSVLLANGPDAVHTYREHVAAADLDKMLEVCEGILARARARSAA